MKLNYRESSWPKDAFAPYQIQLNDGRMIFAPKDKEEVVRLAVGAEEGSQQSVDIPLGEEAEMGKQEADKSS